MPAVELHGVLFHDRDYKATVTGTANGLAMALFAAAWFQPFSEWEATFDALVAPFAVKAPARHLRPLSSSNETLPTTMDRPGGLKVVDAHGQSLAYVYSREKPDDAKGLHHQPTSGSIPLTLLRGRVSHRNDTDKLRGTSLG